jgi:hypothetical protein
METMITYGREGLVVGAERLFETGALGGIGFNRFLGQLGGLGTAGILFHSERFDTFPLQVRIKRHNHFTSGNAL